MRALALTMIAGLVLARGAAADNPTTPSSPSTLKSTTLVLDSFTLSADAQNATDDFWCSFNDYGAFFSNYTGQCPYRDYSATVHWKKVPGATEYDVCLEPVFRTYTPGFQCWVLAAPNSGSPSALSMTFDSATMFLNAFEGTTQVWMVKACALDPVTHTGPCSESNTVSAEIPWTG